MIHRAEANGKLEQGVVKLYHEKRFKNELGDMPDGYVTVTVQRKGRPRTQQRGYYRACVLPEITRHAREFGNELNEDQWHEHFKRKFNPIPIFNKDGDQIDVEGGSTESLTVLQYAEFVDNVVRWASQEMELYIPPPNTQAKIFRHETV